MRRQLKSAGHLLRHLAHAALKEVEQLQAEGAHRALQLHAVGYDVAASPAWIMVTEMTPGVDGPLAGLTMVWKPCTSWQAAGTGSRAQVRHGGMAARRAA